MKKTEALYKKAKKIIPGGTQLLSKRPEMFLPNRWPAYYQKAEGCEVWDLDGKRYIDTSLMGVGSCILGYADKDVNKAVKKSVDAGSMTTLNCFEEVELAELLCDIHPWAHMVRFARTGGEAVSIAVRIARAKTNKDIVLVCGYHGWHDWYLAANLSSKKSLDGHLLPGLAPSGVVRSLRGTTIPFKYNDVPAFLKVIEKYKAKIAAVIMEPVRSISPEKGFLETIRKVTKREKIVFVFDEVSSGWRLNLGGAHLSLKVNPDMAVFAKGISNGYPMAAVLGTKEVMDATQGTFISSTYWTERIGPTAALATIKKMKKKSVSEYLMKVGRQIQEEWSRLADRHALSIAVSGIYPLSHFSFLYDEPLVLKTLFTQFMLEKGFLATNVFYVSYAHKKKHLRQYYTAVDQTFGELAKIIKKGIPREYLKGPVCQSGFKRLT